MEDLIRRIGIFFALVGFVLLALFFASDVQHTPKIGWLLLGSIAFFGGLFMAWTNRGKPQQAERFRFMKKMMSGGGGGEKKKEGKGDIGQNEGEGEGGSGGSDE